MQVQGCALFHLRCKNDIGHLGLSLSTWNGNLRHRKLLDTGTPLQWNGI